MQNSIKIGGFKELLPRDFLHLEFCNISSSPKSCYVSSCASARLWQTKHESLVRKTSQTTFRTGKQKINGKKVLSLAVVCLAIKYRWHSGVFLVSCHDKEQRTSEPILDIGRKKFNDQPMDYFLARCSLFIGSTGISLRIDGLRLNISGPIFYNIHVVSYDAASSWDEWFHHIHHFIYHFLWESSENYRYVRRIIANLCAGSAKLVATTSIRCINIFGTNFEEEKSLLSQTAPKPIWIYVLSSWHNICRLGFKLPQKCYQ